MSWLDKLMLSHPCFLMLPFLCFGWIVTTSWAAFVLYFTASDFDKTEFYSIALIAGGGFLLCSVAFVLFQFVCLRQKKLLGEKRKELVAKAIASKDLEAKIAREVDKKNGFAERRLNMRKGLGIGK